MQPYSVLPEEVNDNQIKALVNYIQSQHLTNRIPSPTNYGVVDAIKNQQVIAPTADDFRNYAMQVDTNSKLGNEWWDRQPSSQKPVGRVKNITEGGSGVYKTDPIKPQYEVYQPTYYTPGFINYMDGWVPWVDSWDDYWHETWTPQ